jgi:methylated-DNA-[protein]-cysteine S-methyltransferase
MTIGQSTADAAIAAVKRWSKETGVSLDRRSTDWFPQLRQRLQRYSEGTPEDFSDVETTRPGISKFTNQVHEACRAIPYGKTVTYGELADQVGHPRAARAVGTVMSKNPTPILVPCHRVLGSNEQLCGFSSPRGVHLKRELLSMEAGVACTPGEMPPPPSKPKSNTVGKTGAKRARTPALNTR